MSAAVTKRKSAPKHPRSAAPSVPLSAAEKVFGLAVATACDRHSQLTAREVQVAEMMADAKGNQQIAEELGISPKTLDIHRANVKYKLQAGTGAAIANVVNLVRLATAANGD